MQITNSPFGSLPSKCDKHSLTVPLIVSSKILEISRDTEMFFSIPQTSLISFNNLIILCGTQTIQQSLFLWKALKSFVSTLFWVKTFKNKICCWKPA